MLGLHGGSRLGGSLATWESGPEGKPLPASENAPATPRIAISASQTAIGATEGRSGVAFRRP